MRKFVIVIVAAFSLNVSAQKLQEAEFIGNVRAFDPNDADSVAFPLDRVVCELIGKATGSKIWWGIGSTRLHIKIPGRQSNCVLGLHKNNQLIVRVGNNDYDPLSQISVFKVSKGPKNRRGEFGKVTKFDGKFNPSTIPNTISFEGKKYGAHSYIISLPDLPVGEYGIFVSNPEQANTTSLIVYTFQVK